MKNYIITICYDGTDYHGWQIQPQKRTIQGIIEEALHHFKSKRIPVTGAGRTDAGVHAAAQVAHFKADLNIPDDELLKALNGNLPPDIRIIKLETTDMNFHSRKNARSKTYQYRIFNAPDITPFKIRYVLHHPGSLNLQKMKQAAREFIREDDFTSFSSNRLRHPVKKIFHSEIKKKEKELIYTVEADGFLKYMVRTIVGALLLVGREKMKPETIETLFKEKKRSSLIPTAQAKGLCLIQVTY